MEYRQDGILRNTLLGLGADGRDVEHGTRPNLPCRRTMTTQELEGLYANDPIAQKVVNKIPEAAVRGGIAINIGGKLADADLMRSIRHTGLVDALGRASRYARLYYRGAAVVLDIDDGQPDGSWNKPVNKKNVKSVAIAFVADGDRVYPSQQNILGIEPDLYTAAISHGESNQISHSSHFHKDRVLWLSGVFTPPNIAIQLDGDISLLANFWTHYQRYVTASALALNMMARSELLNMKRKGLNIMLASSSAAEERSLRREGENIRDRANALGIVVSDMDDTEFEVIKRDLNHITGLIDGFRIDAIAASGGLSELDLFGLSSASSGLAKDDLRDRMMTAIAIQEYQEMQWRKPCERFLELLFLSKDGPTNGTPPKNWELTFPDNLKLTPEESGGLRSQQSNTDKIYVDMGFPADLMIKTRFGSGEWSPQTEIPDNFAIQQPPPPAATEP
jgi:hypothetical protein